MPDYLSIARRALDRPKEPGQLEPLEDVLKGLAIELWSDAAGCLFIVADEDDAFGSDAFTSASTSITSAFAM